MRRKPSMFSKNYRKELKQRRIKRMVLLATVIVVIGIAIISYNKGDVLVKNYFSRDGKNSPLNEEAEGKTDELSENITGEGEKGPIEESNEENSEITFEAKLNSGKSVVVELKDQENKKIISNIICPESVTGVISKTSEKGLIIDEGTQDIYIVDTSEQLISITNPQYIATSNEIFTKESVLQYNPSYKWVERAAFIDDTYVAYSSQLPWINEGGDRYLWIVNINDKTHRGYYNIKGKDFRFGEATSEGINIEIDGKSLVVNSQGKVVSQ